MVYCPCVFLGDTGDAGFLIGDGFFVVDPAAAQTLPTVLLRRLMKIPELPSPLCVPTEQEKVSSAATKEVNKWKRSDTRQQVAVSEFL